MNLNSELSTPSKKTSLKNIFIAVVLGTVTIYLSFKDIALDELWQVIKEADPSTTILSLIVVLINVSFLTLRWWIILAEKWDLKIIISLMNSIYFSQMLNIVLPARLGELGRIFYVGEKLNISKSRALGTLVVEKVIDIVTFGGAVFVLLLVMTLPDWITRPGEIFIVSGLIAFIGVIVMTFQGLKILDLLEFRLPFIPSDWRTRIFSVLRSGLSGLDSMRSWKRQIAAWALSFSSLILSATTNYLLLLALQIDVPLITPLAVLVITQIGSSPPSTPGKLGVFHFMVILALSLFNVDKEIALAYSLILYAVALLPKIIWGAIVMIQSPINLSALRISSQTDST